EGQIEMIAPSLVLILLAQEAVEPPPRRARPVRSSVRVFIEESPKGDYEHDYYEQAAPVQLRTGSATLGSEIWSRTICRPQEEDRSPLVFTVPEQQPVLTLSAVVGAPRIDVSAPKSSVVQGNPVGNPIITKAGLFGGGGSESTTSDSDSPFMVGADLDYVVASDVTSFSLTSWLPQETSFHLYARGLFGSLDIIDVKTD